MKSTRMTYAYYWVLPDDLEDFWFLFVPFLNLLCREVNYDVRQGPSLCEMPSHDVRKWFQADSSCAVLQRHLANGVLVSCPT